MFDVSIEFLRAYLELDSSKGTLALQVKQQHAPCTDL